MAARTAKAWPNLRRQSRSHLSAQPPAADRLVAGYSFGSMVGPAGAADPRVHKIIGVASQWASAILVSSSR